MMKSMVKIYEKMKPEELARIAYNALAGGNQGEYLKIISSCPRRLYDAPDMRYTKTFNCIYSLGHIWAAEYWRLMFVCSAILAELLCPHTDIQSHDRLERQYENAHAELVAHVGAMKRFCLDHAIPLAAVTNQTGVRFELFEKQGQADAVLQDKAYGMLESVFLAWMDGQPGQDADKDDGA